MELSDRMPVGYRGITWLMALLGAVVMVISIWGCAAGQRPPESENTPVLSQEGKDERLLVVTTIFPYYDFVRQIAGDKVKLKLVVPAGMDSHSFEPTPADMIAMQEADVLICNGGEMEQWVKKVLGSLDTSHMKVLTMMDYVDVVEEEPLPACHELLSDPNIIVTPHIGGGTADIGDVIIPMLTEDIKALADGRTPAHVVNKEYMVH